MLMNVGTAFNAARPATSDIANDGRGRHSFPRGWRLQPDRARSHSQYRAASIHLRHQPAAKNIAVLALVSAGIANVRKRSP
ncbi:hypothetical protein KCP77_13675 [Salmonella enterica subsp. enterica]|nr:hypothetical protein KCP77_13675 [Salmonella enterica subsp. enterica]